MDYNPAIGSGFGFPSISSNTPLPDYAPADLSDLEARVHKLKADVDVAAAEAQLKQPPKGRKNPQENTWLAIKIEGSVLTQKLKEFADATRPSDENNAKILQIAQEIRAVYTKYQALTQGLSNKKPASLNYSGTMKHHQTPWEIADEFLSAEIPSREAQDARAQARKEVKAYSPLVVGVRDSLQACRNALAVAIHVHSTHAPNETINRALRDLQTQIKNFEAAHANLKSEARTGTPDEKAKLLKRDAAFDEAWKGFKDDLHAFLDMTHPGQLKDSYDIARTAIAGTGDDSLTYNNAIAKFEQAFYTLSENQTALNKVPAGVQDNALDYFLANRDLQYAKNEVYGAFKNEAYLTGEQYDHDAAIRNGLIQNGGLSAGQLGRPDVMDRIFRMQLLRIDWAHFMGDAEAFNQAVADFEMMRAAFPPESLRTISQSFDQQYSRMPVVQEVQALVDTYTQAKLALDSPVLSGLQSVTQAANQLHRASALLAQLTEAHPELATSFDSYVRLSTALQAKVDQVIRDHVSRFEPALREDPITFNKLANNLQELEQLQSAVRFATPDVVDLFEASFEAHKARLITFVESEITPIFDKVERVLAALESAEKYKKGPEDTSTAGRKEAHHQFVFGDQAEVRQKLAGLGRDLSEYHNLLNGLPDSIKAEVRHQFDARHVKLEAQLHRHEDFERSDVGAAIDFEAALSLKADATDVYRVFISQLRTARDSASKSDISQAKANVRELIEAQGRRGGPLTFLTRMEQRAETFGARDIALVETAKTDWQNYWSETVRRDAAATRTALDTLPMTLTTMHEALSAYRSAKAAAARIVPSDDPDMNLEPLGGRLAVINQPRLLDRDRDMQRLRDQFYANPAAIGPQGLLKRSPYEKLARVLSQELVEMQHAAGFPQVRSEHTARARLTNFLTSWNQMSDKQKAAVLANKEFAQIFNTVQLDFKDDFKVNALRIAGEKLQNLWTKKDGSNERQDVLLSMLVNQYDRLKEKLSQELGEDFIDARLAAPVMKNAIDVYLRSKFPRGSELAMMLDGIMTDFDMNDPVLITDTGIQYDGPALLARFYDSGWLPVGDLPTFVREAAPQLVDNLERFSQQVLGMSKDEREALARAQEPNIPMNEQELLKVINKQLAIDFYAQGGMGGDDVKPSVNYQRIMAARGGLEGFAELRQRGRLLGLATPLLDKALGKHYEFVRNQALDKAEALVRSGTATSANTLPKLIAELRIVKDSGQMNEAERARFESATAPIEQAILNLNSISQGVQRALRMLSGQQGGIGGIVPDLGGAVLGGLKEVFSNECLALLYNDLMNVRDPAEVGLFLKDWAKLNPATQEYLLRDGEFFPLFDAVMSAYSIGETSSETPRMQSRLERGTAGAESDTFAGAMEVLRDARTSANLAATSGSPASQRLTKADLGHALAKAQKTFNTPEIAQRANALITQLQSNRLPNDEAQAPAVKEAIFKKLVELENATADRAPGLVDEIEMLFYYMPPKVQKELDSDWAFIDVMNQYRGDARFKGYVAPRQRAAQELRKVDDLVGERPQAGHFKSLTEAATHFAKARDPLALIQSNRLPNDEAQAPAVKEAIFKKLVELESAAADRAPGIVDEIEMLFYYMPPKVQKALDRDRAFTDVMNQYRGDARFKGYVAPRQRAVQELRKVDDLIGERPQAGHFESLTEAATHFAKARDLLALMPDDSSKLRQKVDMWEKRFEALMALDSNESKIENRLMHGRPGGVPYAATIGMLRKHMAGLLLQPNAADIEARKRVATLERMLGTLRPIPVETAQATQFAAEVARYRAEVSAYATYKGIIDSLNVRPEDFNPADFDRGLVAGPHSKDMAGLVGHAQRDRGMLLSKNKFALREALSTLNKAWKQTTGALVNYIAPGDYAATQKGFVESRPKLSKAASELRTQLLAPAAQGVNIKLPGYVFKGNAKEVVDIFHDQLVTVTEADLAGEPMALMAAIADFVTMQHEIFSNQRDKGDGLREAHPELGQMLFHFRDVYRSSIDDVNTFREMQSMLNLEGNRIPDALNSLRINEAHISFDPRHPLRRAYTQIVATLTSRLSLADHRDAVSRAPELMQSDRRDLLTQSLQAHADNNAWVQMVYRNAKQQYVSVFGKLEMDLENDQVFFTSWDNENKVRLPVSISDIHSAVSVRTGGFARVDVEELTPERVVSGGLRSSSPSAPTRTGPSGSVTPELQSQQQPANVDLTDFRKELRLAAHHQSVLLIRADGADFVSEYDVDATHTENVRHVINLQELNEAIQPMGGKRVTLLMADGSKPSGILAPEVKHSVYLRNEAGTQAIPYPLEQVNQIILEAKAQPAVQPEQEPAPLKHRGRSRTHSPTGQDDAAGELERDLSEEQRSLEKAADAYWSGANVRGLSPTPSEGFDGASGHSFSAHVTPGSDLPRDYSRSQSSLRMEKSRSPSGQPKRSPSPKDKGKSDIARDGGRARSASPTARFRPQEPQQALPDASSAAVVEPKLTPAQLKAKEDEAAVMSMVERQNEMAQFSWEAKTAMPGRTRVSSAVRTALKPFNNRIVKVTIKELGGKDLTVTGTIRTDSKGGAGVYTGGVLSTNQNASLRVIPWETIETIQTYNPLEPNAPAPPSLQLKSPVAASSTSSSSVVSSAGQGQSMKEDHPAAIAQPPSASSSSSSSVAPELGQDASSSSTSATARKGRGLRERVKPEISPEDKANARAFVEKQNAMPSYSYTRDESTLLTEEIREKLKDFNNRIVRITAEGFDFPLIGMIGTQYETSDASVFVNGVYATAIRADKKLISYDKILTIETYNPLQELEVAGESSQPTVLPEVTQSQPKVAEAEPEVPMERSRARSPEGKRDRSPSAERSAGPSAGADVAPVAAPLPPPAPVKPVEVAKLWQTNIGQLKANDWSILNGKIVTVVTGSGDQEEERSGSITTAGKAIFINNEAFVRDRKDVTRMLIHEVVSQELLPMKGQEVKVKFKDNSEQSGTLSITKRGVVKLNDQTLDLASIRVVQQKGYQEPAELELQDLPPSTTASSLTESESPVASPSGERHRSPERKRGESPERSASSQGELTVEGEALEGQNLVTIRALGDVSDADKAAAVSPLVNLLVEVVYEGGGEAIGYLAIKNNVMHLFQNDDDAVGIIAPWEGVNHVRMIHGDRYDQFMAGTAPVDPQRSAGVKRRDALGSHESETFHFAQSIRHADWSPEQFRALIGQKLTVMPPLGTHFAPRKGVTSELVTVEEDRLGFKVRDKIGYFPKENFNYYIVHEQLYEAVEPFINQTVTLYLDANSGTRTGLLRWEEDKIRLYSKDGKYETIAPQRIVDITTAQPTKKYLRGPPPDVAIINPKFEPGVRARPAQKKRPSQRSVTSVTTNPSGAQKGTEEVSNEGLDVGERSRSRERSSQTDKRHRSRTP